MLAKYIHEHFTKYFNYQAAQNQQPIDNLQVKLPYAPTHSTSSPPCDLFIDRKLMLGHPVCNMFFSTRKIQDDKVDSGNPIWCAVHELCGTGFL